MHAYLGGISKTLNCPPIIVGGVEDHVHLLARTITQAEWVKELKRLESLVERGGPGYSMARRIRGFSVSQSNLEAVRAYVANQAAHHQRLSFQDELRALLRKHDVDFDERYIWD